MRSLGATSRRIEREPRRRQRELEKQRIFCEKMPEQEKAIQEAQLYENRIDIILSVHRECGELCDWASIQTNPPPEKPSLSRNHEEMARGRIRSGLPLQKRFLSITEAQLKYRLKRSDIEIEFEKERRRIVPDAASRLDCIFVADNEDTINQIFKGHYDLIVLEVKLIEALRFTKADFGWFEEYSREKDKRLIEGYWTSHQFRENVNSWEYLVDGIIRADDPSSSEKVRSYYNNIKYEYN